MRRTRLAAALIGALAVLAVPATAGAAVGGPVILGGDDQTDHGSVNGSGAAARALPAPLMGHGLAVLLASAGLLVLAQLVFNMFAKKIPERL